MFVSLQKLSELTGLSKYTIKARLEWANVYHRGKGRSMAYESGPALRAIYERHDVIRKHPSSSRRG